MILAVRIASWFPAGCVAEQVPLPNDPDLLARLVREGVTHVFSGARGGRLMPKELDPSPHYVLLYSCGPARVYKFVPDPS